MKLRKHIQGPNTNTQVKFQGHSLNLNSFTPHMCGVQCHLAQNANIAIYPYDHFRL